MARTEDRIRTTLDRVATTTTVSSDALERMASSRRSSRSWGLVAGAGLVAAGLATVLAVGLITRAAPSVDGSSTDVMGSPSTSGGDAGAAWSGLDYVGAVDQLLTLTDDLPPVPVPTATEDLQYETVLVSGWQDGDVGDLVRWTTRIDDAGTATITTESFGEVSRSGGLDQWRATYATADPVTMGSRTEDASRHALSDEDREQLVEQTREQASGSREPDPQRTERPEQASAFMLASDLVRGTAAQDSAVESQREALELVRDLDPSLVSYGGTVDHITGREVVVLRAFDQANDGWNVLLFDADSGRYAGAGFQTGEGDWSYVEAYTEPRLVAIS